jgi:hypothetical protein
MGQVKGGLFLILLEGLFDFSAICSPETPLLEEKERGN